MPRIHATAQVDPGAELADDVEVGAFSIVGPHVAHRRRHGHRPARSDHRPDDDRRAQPDLPVHLDRRNSAGPQVRRRADDHRHRRRQRRSANTCRSTRGRRCDRGSTTIGNANLLLAYVHIAHDCVIGDSTTFSNNAQLAGHVTVGDWVVLGGFTGVHQFVRIGAHAMIGGGAVVLQDVPPFVMVQRVSGEAARHQQRRAAPTRLFGGGHPGRAPRLQDALPRRTLARRGEGRARRRCRDRRRCCVRSSISSPRPIAASSADPVGTRAAMGDAAALRSAHHRDRRRRGVRRRARERC